MTKGAEELKAAAAAKAGIDRMFSRLGKSLDAADPVVLLLARRSGAAIGLANAAALLARNGQVAEAAGVAEKLLAAAAEIRAAAGPGGRAAAEEALAREGDFSAAPLRGPELARKLEGLDFPSDLKAAPEALWRARPGTGQLPWGHRFDDGRAPLGAEDLLRMTASAMGQVLSALEAIWGSKLSKTPTTPPKKREEPK